MSKLTHFNAKGEAHMVNVSNKVETRRMAIAEGRIQMQTQTLNMILEGGHKKGDVLGIARLAGIMAAKKTSELVPLCHPLPLTQISVDLSPDRSEASVVCRATAETVGRTGVEMEALTAVQVALLTVYDMCKAVDRGMTISDVRLLEKSGGKSGTWTRSEEKTRRVNQE